MTNNKLKIKDSKTEFIVFFRSLQAKQDLSSVSVYEGVCIIQTIFKCEGSGSNL